VAQVVLKEITKGFRHGVIAVDQVSLEIKDQEFFVILGPSGCGKTTLLRIIAGLEEADAGEIYIGSRLVNYLAPKERDIAMVFQNYALYPHMTVFENMAFALKLRKLPKDEINRRVAEAAKILGIENLLSRKPGELSGGQRQRVAVGRAIVRHPKVFLFDEPLSNLDAKLRVGMRAELARLHQRLRTTIIYVTHDQIEAMTLGQRIGVMKDGKLIQVADPKNLYDHPVNRFVAGFIGSPPMNLYHGLVIKNPLRFVNPSFTIEISASSIPSLVDDREVYLGIRPEHIKISQTATLSALVEVTENLGNEALVYLKIGTEHCTLRTTPNRAPLPGETINIEFDQKNWHIFDAQTEQRLN